MKRLLKILGIIVGLVVLVVAASASYIHFSGIPSYEPGNITMKVEVTPERVAKGQKIASMLCVECHADESGKLTGHLLQDVPKEFGKIYSKNITHDPEVGIGSWTDGELYYLLRTGIKRDGQYIPPYMVKFPLAADEDIKSIIAFLRSDNYAVQPAKEEAPMSEPSFLTKFLCRVAFKPLPLPAKEVPLPDTNDAVAHGKYLATAVYGCFACHSKDFKTMNELEPEKSEGYFGGGNPLLNMEGKVVYSANITFDPSGIAQYSEDDFVQAVKNGRKKDGSMTRYPMKPHTQLTDTEVKAIYAYLKTVPKISNAVAKN
jgi:cytochrome c2